MRMRTLGRWIAAFALVLTTGACGGGGGSGLAGSTPTVTFTSTLLPQLSSGQATEYALPLAGGCGGPYTIRVIGGALPDGIQVDDRQAGISGPGNPAAHRHHLVGTSLKEGTFPFTLEVTDRGCRPFATVSQAMTWVISRGTVTIVNATPAIIPVANYNDPLKYPDVDALDKTVYGSFVSINFIVAGGVGPYTCAILDDPADPNDDGGLPLGVVMPPNSCSLVGSPQQVGAGGKPFRLTVRATDSVGQSVTRKLQWKIDTPPMIVGSATLANGTAGITYGDAIQIVDGVPPFAFEFTAEVPNPNDNVSTTWTYAPPLAPVVPSGSGFTLGTTGPASNKLTAANYPAAAAPGPYGPAPSEGLYIIETGGQAGSIVGTPRRYGAFTVNVHAYSSTVPNERGQHAFAQFAFTIAQGGSLTMLDSFVVDGDGSNSFLANTPDGVATLPEFEVLQPKQIQMAATGGVPYDGWTDAPHRNQRALAGGEVAGSYDWAVSNWDSRAFGWHPANSPAGRPTGIDATITGRIQTTGGGLDLVRQGRQVIEVTLKDQRLPLQQTDVHEMALSVGPDAIIITDSNQSAIITTGSTYDSTAHNDSMYIKKFSVVNNVGSKAVLDATDLAATHIVPAAANLNALSNPLGRLLSGVGKASYTGTGRDGAGSDLMRIVVNAGGWWDDSFNLHPKAARAFQHADADKSYYEYYGNEYYCYGPQPDASAVALPDITDGSVTHNPSSGVYTNGGKLYAFENDTHFGVFVIREEGRIYVPFAMEKGSFNGFGDGVIVPLQGTGVGAPTDSQMRTVHLGVSPNGRFAAIKIKASPTNLTETASQSRVVLMDLGGTKAFSGATYRIVSASSANGYIMADTLTLTNANLYFTVSSTTVGLNSPYGWLAHNVMRESILSGSGTAAFAPGLPSNTASTWLSLPYHNTPTQYMLSYAGTWNSTTVYTTYYAYAGGCAANRLEDDTAPTPFRVSADGTTCVVMASPYNGVTLGSSAFLHRPYVDKNGAGFLQAAGTDRRAPYGATRAHRLRFGTAYYGFAGMAQWGKHEGPSGGLEISDNGNRIAYTVSQASPLSSGTYYSTYQVYYNLDWRISRMDVIASETTNNWASFTERQVTSTFFGGSHYWRFGGLSFSRDNNRLYFFGGISQKDALGTGDSYIWTTSVNNASAFVTGTYYSFDFTNTTQVRSVMPTSAGGTGANTYTTSSPFNPTAANLTANWGVIAPYGGFWSANGNFLYINTGHPLSSSDGTCHRLVGINTTTTTINGKAPNTGFELGNWPQYRGLLGTYSSPGLYYGGMLTYLAPSGTHSTARIKMAKDTGVVYFATHSMRYSTTPSTSYGVVYGLYYHSTYAKDAGNIECFASNVGGNVQRLTNFTNDGTLASPRGRGINFIDVTRAGDRLVFIYDNGSAGGVSEYLRNLSNEGMGYIAGISLNPTTGNLVSRTFTLLEGNEGGAGKVGGSNGRAGGSVAFGTDGQRLYYSFGPGASDENQRTLVAPRIDGAGELGSGTGARFGSGARENVLHAGR